jgi:hypothetical protein
MENHTIDKKRLAIVVSGVFVAWLAALLIGLVAFTEWEQRGQFGDLFGSVNALFSGLAFAGLIYAILLQRQELGLQRRELQLQREEMAASRAELARQADVQAALARATVAQIKVVAFQVRVEATKMEADINNPHRRGPQIARIHEMATEIDKVCAALERDIRVPA